MDTKGHGVASDAHGHGDKGYNNEVGSDHESKEGEPVDVQNNNVAKDNGNKIYAKDGYHSVYNSD